MIETTYEYALKMPLSFEQRQSLALAMSEGLAFIFKLGNDVLIARKEEVK